MKEEIILLWRFDVGKKMFDLIPHFLLRLSVRRYIFHLREEI